MRRVLAITLLVVFGSPLVAPLLSATVDPDASVPACCRSHGTHHCVMLHGILVTGGGSVLSAPPCPLYPTGVTLPRFATASTPRLPSIVAAALRNYAGLTHQLHARTFRVCANLKRGPPVHAA